MSRKYAPRMAAAERREQLLDCALEVFVVQGSEAFTIGSVAEKAGVTRPVVYDFFANAGELTKELLKREERRATAQVAQALADVDLEADPQVVVLGVTRAFLEAVAESPNTWSAALMTPTGAAPIVRRQIRRGRAGVIKQVETILEQAIEAGRIPEIDVPIAARTLVMLGEGAARLVLAEGREFPPERVAEFISGVLGSIPQPSTRA